MSKPKIIFEPPTFSWDKPIEDEILSYVRSMKSLWHKMSVESIWPHVREEAKSFVTAYESVEKHIVKEVELRQKIKRLREQGNEL